MKTEKQLQGFAGEDMAANLLLQKGYRILERNWRCGHLEVDIIAETDDWVAMGSLFATWHGWQRYNTDGRQGGAREPV